MDTRGLYEKYEVKRVDGKVVPNAKYFVLDYQNDPAAREAVSQYAWSCEFSRPELHKNLLDMLESLAKFRVGDTVKTVKNIVDPGDTNFIGKICKVIGILEFSDKGQEYIVLCVDNKEEMFVVEEELELVEL
jgi:hypothetical protein